MRPRGASQNTLTGRLVGAAAKSHFGDVVVWFSYLPVDDSADQGGGVRLETRADDKGEFEFELPLQPLSRATVGAVVEGAMTVDLEPNGEQLEPGDVIIMVDDSLPAHLRYA